MAAYKAPDFNERADAARAARQKALEQLRAKPAPDPDLIAARLAAAAAREAAAAAKRQAKRDAEAAKAAERAAKAEAERAAAEAERLAAEAKRAPVQTPAEAKALRDARYAARKGRAR